MSLEYAPAQIHTIFYYRFTRWFSTRIFKLLFFVTLLLYESESIYNMYTVVDMLLSSSFFYPRARHLKNINTFKKIATNDRVSNNNEGICCYIHANRRTRVVVYFIPAAIALYEYLNSIIFIFLFVFFFVFF